MEKRGCFRGITGFKIAVLVAVYNRQGVTIPNLRLLEQELQQVGCVDPTIFVLDDMSPDGTGMIIREQLPSVRVIDGTGQLFWNRGMGAAFRAAEAYARDHEAFDAFLLFNDDVTIRRGVLANFVASFKEANREGSAILVGSTAATGQATTTYGGLKAQSKWRPLKFRLLDPNGSLQRCDAFNGNFVLVPADFLSSIGGLDQKFVHYYGDIDLGFTATAHGIGIYIWDDYIGWCDMNLKSEGTPKIDRLARVIFGRESVWESLYLVRKHRPVFAYIFAIPHIIKRVLAAIW